MTNFGTMTTICFAAEDGKRIARRHKVFLPVRMTIPQGETRVHLINVSATGALAHHDAPPPTGTAVAIVLKARALPGRIVWAQGRRFGIAFAERLDDSTLHALFGLAEAAPVVATPATISVSIPTG